MKVYRYRSMRWIAIIIIATAGAVFGAIAYLQATQRGGGSPLLAYAIPNFVLCAGLAYGLGWVQRVEADVDAGELRVISIFGQAKVFDLGEAIETRMAEGESAKVLQLSQGKTKANIHEYIDDFAELRGLVEKP